MSFLAAGMAAGVNQGLGQGLNNMLQYKLDAERRKADSVAKIWQTMANDPSYHPAVRQQALQNMGIAGSYDPMNPDSKKAFEDIQKQNPHDLINKVNEAQQLTGYWNPETGTKDPIKFDQAETEAKFGTQLRLMSQLPKALGGTTGVDDENDLDSRRSRASTVHQLMPHFPSVMETPVQGGVTYKDDTGIMQQGKPGVLYGDNLGSGYWAYTQNGWRKINPDSTLAPQKTTVQNPDGSLGTSWITPGMEGSTPTGVAPPPVALGQQTSSSSFTDPNTLQHTTSTNTQKIMTPPPVAAAPPLGGTPAISGKIIPTQYSGVKGLASDLARRSAPRAKTPPPVWNSGALGTAWKPDAAAIKNANSPKNIQLENDSWDAMQTIDKIAQLNTQHPMLGAVFGRFMEAANKLGSAELISGGAKLAGRARVEEENRLVTKNLDKLIRDKSVYQQFGVPPNEYNGFASAAGEMITLIRSLGVMDVHMLASSANGISRMYQMMLPSLISPDQDAPLAIGHAIGIGDMAATRLHSIYLNRYGSDIENHLAPSRKDLAKRFGILASITGGSGAGLNTPPATGVKTTVATGGPDRGKTLYQHKDGHFYVKPETP